MNKISPKGKTWGCCSHTRLQQAAICVGPEYTMWVPMEIISLYLEFIYKHGRYNN